jgi:cellulose synthase/poly-beta-1,6-N-acetylglucosamine synthase-like glycosyltransferase
VSIIIPAHNEEHTLRNTVLGLLGQSLREYEIIIGENNSTDRTLEVARELERMYPDRVKVLNLHPPRNKMPISWVLNRMLEVAKYDLICRIDADSTLEDKLAIAKLMSPMVKDSNVSATGGNVRIRNKSSMLLKMQGIEFLLANEINKRHMRKTSICLSGCYMGFRKSRLPGGFIEKKGISEDMTATIELSNRINGKTLFVHDSIVFTDGMKTLKELKKQRQWWNAIGLRAYYHNRRVILNRNFGLVGINLGITIALSCRSFFGLIFRVAESAQETITDTLTMIALISIMHFSVTLLNVHTARKLSSRNERVSIGQVASFALWYGPLVGAWRFASTISVLGGLFSWKRRKVRYASSSAITRSSVYENAS